MNDMTDRDRLDAIRAIIMENSTEVTNENGGVIGYIMRTEPEQTAELWSLSDWADANAQAHLPSVVGH